MTLPAQRTPTQTPSQRATTPLEGLLWEPVSAFVLDGLNRRAGQAIATWAVARVVGGAYTLISTDSGSMDLAGTTVAWEDSLCQKLQADTGNATVVVGDLHRHRALRATAQHYGVRAYAGAPLRARDGTRIGSLCGWSPTPTRDEQHLQALVDQQVRFMEQTLHRQLQRVDLSRRRDWSNGPAGGAQHPVAHADGWQQLLAREDDRGRFLADPATITVIDLPQATGPGHRSRPDVGRGQTRAGARTHARAAKLLAQVLQDAVGAEGAVAQPTFGRFAVLSHENAGTTTAQASPAAASSLSDRVLESVRIACPHARTGRAVRRGTEDLLNVWAQAESQAAQDEQAAPGQYS